MSLCILQNGNDERRPIAGTCYPTANLQTTPFKVLEVETVKLTPELRRRLPFLSHLPIHCDVSFLEMDMAGLISEGTAHKFREGGCRFHGSFWLFL